MRFFLVGLLSMLCASTASADILRTQGRSYIGSLDSVRQGEVAFDIDALDETVTIDFDDVTDLQTDSPRFVVFGTDGSVTGVLLGIHDGALEVQPDTGPPTKVRVEDLWSVDDPVGNRVTAFVGSQLRYWSGSFDLGVTATQATTDTSQFLVSLAGKREKGPSEINLSLGYRFGRQKDQGEASKKNLNEINGSIDVRHDLQKDLFAFGEIQATYDAIQFLSIRAQPVLGVGYDLIDTEDANFSVKLGTAWIYERYFSQGADDYAALSFGVSGDWDLPWDAKLTGSVSYRPALDAWSENFLIQAKGTAEVPISSHLSFKLSLKNDYTSQPSEDAVPNSFYFNVALSLNL